MKKIKIINYILIITFIFLGSSSTFYSSKVSDNFIVKGVEEEVNEEEEEETTTSQKDSIFQQKEQEVVTFEKKFDTSSLLVNGEDWLESLFGDEKVEDENGIFSKISRQEGLEKSLSFEQWIEVKLKNFFKLKKLDLQKDNVYLSEKDDETELFDYIVLDNKNLWFKGVDENKLSKLNYKILYNNLQDKDNQIDVIVKFSWKKGIKKNRQSVKEMFFKKRHFIVRITRVNDLLFEEVAERINYDLGTFSYGDDQDLIFFDFEEKNFSRFEKKLNGFFMKNYLLTDGKEVNLFFLLLKKSFSLDKFRSDLVDFSKLETLPVTFSEDQLFQDKDKNIFLSRNWLSEKIKTRVGNDVVEIELFAFFSEENGFNSNLTAHNKQLVNFRVLFKFNFVEWKNVFNYILSETLVKELEI